MTNAIAPSTPPVTGPMHDGTYWFGLATGGLNSQEAGTAAWYVPVTAGVPGITQLFGRYWSGLVTGGLKTQWAESAGTKVPWIGSVPGIVQGGVVSRYWFGSATGGSNVQRASCAG